MIESSWIHIGLHGDYHWLEVEGDTHISLLVRAFPELVHDRFIAATSFAGGVPHLSDSEQTEGWTVRNGIAYSPKLREGFPRYYADDPPSVFDEWYAFESPKDLGERVEGAVFDQPPSAGRTLVFANWLMFRLSESEDDSTDFLRSWFWQQMEWIRPEAFVSEAPGCWILVTKDEELIERVSDYLYDIAS
jgi:hypothetical protein